MGKLCRDLHLPDPFGGTRVTLSTSLSGLGAPANGVCGGVTPRPIFTCNEETARVLEEQLSQALCTTSRTDWGSDILVAYDEGKRAARRAQWGAKTTAAEEDAPEAVFGSLFEAETGPGGDAPPVAEPFIVPLGVERSANAKTRVDRNNHCQAHGKPSCGGICMKILRNKKRLSIQLCCQLHHKEDDGLAVDFCQQHRMTRCGRCTSSNICCRVHHRDYCEERGMPMGKKRARHVGGIADRGAPSPTAAPKRRREWTTEVDPPPPSPATMRDPAGTVGRSENPVGVEPPPTSSGVERRAATKAGKRRRSGTYGPAQSPRVELRGVPPRSQQRKRRRRGGGAAVVEHEPQTPPSGRSPPHHELPRTRESLSPTGDLEKHCIYDESRRRRSRPPWRGARTPKKSPTHKRARDSNSTPSQALPATTPTTSSPTMGVPGQSQNRKRRKRRRRASAGPAAVSPPSLPPVASPVPVQDPGFALPARSNPEPGVKLK